MCRADTVVVRPKADSHPTQENALRIVTTTMRANGFAKARLFVAESFVQIKLISNPVSLRVEVAQARSSIYQLCVELTVQ